MYTRPTFNHILMIGGICLLVFSMTLISPAFSAEERLVSLEVAVQTALRENPELHAIREKLKVARARIEGIPLLSNPELGAEFAGGIDGNQELELTQTFHLGRQRGHQRRIAKIHLEKVNAELAEASRLLTKLVKIALIKEVIQHSEQMHDIAQFQFEAGDISVTQVNLANIQLQSVLRDAVKLEGELQLAQLELNALMVFMSWHFFKKNLS